MTVELGDGSLYLSFRGTDDSIAGWKEDFLLEIGTDTVRQVLEDGTVLRVVGIPFYNRKKRGLEFRKGMERLLHLDEEEERSS